MKSLINGIQIKDYRNENIDIEIKINELKENFNGMSIEINKKKKLQQLEQVVNLSTYPSQHFNSFCYDDDDDDDEEFSIPMSEIYKKYKSSVKDLNLTPSEFEDLSDDLSEDLSKDLSDIEKSNFIKSLLSRDTLLVSSPNFDSLLEEFSGELAHIDLISPEIDEDDLDLEEEVRLVEKLFDSLMEEINIFLASDDSIPPSIENDDYDSNGDVLFLEELLNNDSISLLENESFHFNHYYDPSSPRPPMKPPDDDEIHFDAEPDTGILTVKVVDDISERYVLKPRILPTQPTLSLCLVIDTLNLGILASKDEKSPHLLSHRGFKAFQIIFYFSESSMMIYGGNISILDVQFLCSILLDQLKIAPDYEDSRGRGFVLRSLELQSLA
uniref:Reverse transcriptase domain-containing protein n=1 Tax=Tanacetum cinerariifolium TaxID=118510 RepID=A0A6L2NAL9_TANCI|nr:hypothetical protein [Tanacetum cinerariifolium]